MHSSTSCRKKPASKRTLIGILIAIAMLIILSLSAAMGVFHFLFARTGPERLISHYTSASLDGCVRVRIPEDSQSLQGYLFSPDSRRGVILMAHGFHADALCHVGEIEYFSRHGWCVLAFDGTGTGDSDGSSTIGLEQMRLDLCAAIDFIRNDEALCSLPILLYGHSMGGYASASLCDNPNVSGVISISGFNAPVETMHYFSKKYVGILADVEYPLLYLQNRLLFGPGSNRSAVEAINAADTPVMIVYGSGDQTIPYSISIYSHRQEFTNPNTTCIYIDEPYRNTHSTGWLSSTSARNTVEMNEQLDALLERYGEDIPPDDQRTLCDALSQRDIFEVDEAFMMQVLRFCENAVQGSAE